MKILVTGSGGLIGSEVSEYFGKKNYKIIGIDNNSRRVFFGNEGDVNWKIDYLKSTLNNYFHYDIDIKNFKEVKYVLEKEKPDAVIHCAAQPSHDKATSIILEDFETNSLGTINLLKASYEEIKNSPFIFLSTNKVYGDSPNELPLIELDCRFDFDGDLFKKGINESQRIDKTKHSFFGASKLSADIYVQEFGKYFGMQTCCLRGGCLTGPSHSGVELHGYLSYLVKCFIIQREYKIIGYKGKQVRDNIHSRDVSIFIDQFLNSPKSGVVYNIGGGYENSCSIIEAINILTEKEKNKMNFTYSKDNRIGDHICYYSDLSNIKKDFPNWSITIPLNEIFDELIFSWKKKADK